MKNSSTAVLIAVTLAFAAFAGGFYLGRNTAQNSIEISAYQTTASPTSPTSSATEPSQTVPASTSADNAALQPAATSDPTAPSATAADSTTGSTEPASFPININTATLEELVLLPGIGPTLAQRILDFREEIGSFRHIDELLDVKGIGEKKLAKIREYITL